MTEHTHDLVEQFFGGRLSSSDWKRLVAHLQECPACNSHYQARRANDAEATGHTPDDLTLTDREIELSADILVQRLAQLKTEPAPAPQVGASKAASASGQRTPHRRSLHAIGASVAAVALVAGLVLLLRRPGIVPDVPTEYSARKGSDPPVWIDVVCVESDGNGKPLPNPRVIEGQGACPSASYLAVRAQSLDPTFRAAAAVFMVADEPPLVAQASLEPEQRVVVASADGKSVPLGRTGTTVVALLATRHLASGEILAIVESKSPFNTQATTELRPLADGTRVVARLFRITMQGPGEP